MFRRLEHNIPADEPSPSSLEEFGFKVTEESRIVSTGSHGTAGKPAGQLFKFYNYNDENSNRIREEAMHEIVRGIVLNKLESLGLKELFLSGDDGSTITLERPTGPHISILAPKDLDSLRTRRDVVIVIGEHTQDLGIWAWRDVMGENGYERGSAIGLAKRLARNTHQMSGKDEEPGRELEHEMRMMTLEYGDAVASHDSRFTTGASEPPAIIVLNPGQRIFSHDLNKAMTMVTWLGRPQGNVLQRPFLIDQNHNLVKGHESPLYHVNTVFKRVLPQLLQATADLYVVGIADGAREFALYMDKELSGNTHNSLPQQVRAFAAIEPTYDPEEMQSDAMKLFLYHCARAWVMSEEPKDSLLSVPGVRDPPPVAANTPTALAVENGSSNTEAAPEQRSAVINEALDEGNITDGKASAEEPNGELTSVSVGSETHPDAAASAALDSAAVVNSMHGQTSEENLGNADYDDTTKPVLTPTFSSGVTGATEIVWPAVIDNVLLFFRGVALVITGTDRT